MSNLSDYIIDKYDESVSFLEEVKHYSENSYTSQIKKKIMGVIFHCLLILAGIFVFLYYTLKG